MKNILMVDFDPGEFPELLKLHDMEFCRTIWNGGQTDLPLNGASLVFFNAEYQNLHSSTVHQNNAIKLRALLDEGAAVFVFLGTCATFHLRNLIGLPSNIGAQGPSNPATSQSFLPVNEAAPLARVFELY